MPNHWIIFIVWCVFIMFSIGGAYLNDAADVIRKKPWYLMGYVICHLTIGCAMASLNLMAFTCCLVVFVVGMYIYNFVVKSEQLSATGHVLGPQNQIAGKAFWSAFRLGIFHTLFMLSMLYTAGLLPEIG